MPNQKTSHLRLTFGKGYVENPATLKFRALIYMKATVIPIPTFFFLKAAYKLNFPHYTVDNISHPNCTKQKLHAFIIFM
jgi:hypothetical protein